MWANHCCGARPSNTLDPEFACPEAFGANQPEESNRRFVRSQAQSSHLPVPNRWTDSIAPSDPGDRPFRYALWQRMVDGSNAMPLHAYVLAGLWTRFGS